MATLMSRFPTFGVMTAREAPQKCPESAAASSPAQHVSPTDRTSTRTTASGGIHGRHSAAPRLPELFGISILLVPTLGPTLFWTLVVMDMLYGALVGAVLVTAALTLEAVVLQRRWRDAPSGQANTAAGRSSDAHRDEHKGMQRPS